MITDPPNRPRRNLHPNQSSLSSNRNIPFREKTPPQTYSSDMIPWYRISRTYWLFLAPENAPFWSIQVPKAFLELKGALNAHILDFSGAGNCTFLEFLGTWYLRGLFGVKRGLKLAHFGIFWPQIMNLFGVFRETIKAFFGYQKMHLFGVFRHLNPF